MNDTAKIVNKMIGLLCKLDIIYSKRSIKCLFIILVGLISLMLSLSIIISNLNVNRYKERIEHWVLTETGTAIAIDGSINLSVLPRVALEIQKLSIKDGTKKNPDIKTESLKLKPKLLPLLLGKLIFNIELNNFKIFSYQFEDLQTKLTFKNGNIELFNTKMHPARPLGESSKNDSLSNLIEIDYFKIDTNSSTPKYYLKHQSECFPLSTYLDIFESDINLLGPSIANVELNAEGLTAAQVINSLCGQIDLEMRAGKAHGLDIIATLKDAKSLLQTFAEKFSENFGGFSRHKESSKEKLTKITPYNIISMKAKVDKGIIYKNINVNHDDYHIQGSGIINIIKNSIECQLEARYHDHSKIKQNHVKAKLHPLKIHIRGNLKNPNIQADLKSYFKFIQPQNQLTKKLSPTKTKPQKKPLTNFFSKIINP